MKFWFAFFTISSFQDCETAMVREKWNFRNSEIFEEEIFKNVKTANKRWCCILAILTSSSAKMYSSELGGVRRLKYGMDVPSPWSNFQQYLNDDIIQTSVSQPVGRGPLVGHGLFFVGRQTYLILFRINKSTIISKKYIKKQPNKLISTLFMVYKRPKGV